MQFFQESQYYQQKLFRLIFMVNIYTFIEQNGIICVYNITCTMIKTTLMDSWVLLDKKIFAWWIKIPLKSIIVG